MGGGTVGNVGHCDTISIIVSDCVNVGTLNVEEEGVNLMSDSVVVVWREDSNDVAVETDGWHAAK